MRPQLAVSVAVLSAALLCGSAPEPPPPPPSPYCDALDLKAQAEAALARGRPSAANELIQQAIYRLGDFCHPEHVIDDTGQRLIYCLHHARKGRPEDVYRCRSEMLASQLAMCAPPLRCAAKAPAASPKR